MISTGIVESGFKGITEKCKKNLYSLEKVCTLSLRELTWNVVIHL